MEDENKILLLLQSGLNSQEISERLNLDKLEIDLFIIRNYCSAKTRRHKLELFEEIIKELHENPNLSYITLSNKYPISAKMISHHLTKSGVYFYRKSARVQHKFNEALVKQMYQELLAGSSLAKIGKARNVSWEVVVKLFKKYNLQYPIPNCNSDFFDKIDTEEKAYWLGFLYADGNISQTDNKISCDLKIIDVQHLLKLKQSLKSTTNVCCDTKLLNRCRFSIRNAQLHDSLIKQGCVPNKSLILTFPDTNVVSEDLIRHFIRGYFDGDGCLSFNKNRYCIPNVSILGTKQFLEKLETTSNFKWRWVHDSRHNSNIYSIHADKNHGIDFLNWIYSDCTIYLERKYQRYLIFKNNHFAVYKSDFIDNDRAISAKAKFWINNYFKIDFDKEYANAEITKEIKESLVS